LIYFGLIGTASLVNIQLQENGYKTEPIQTGTFNFQGIEGTYETTWLGDLRSRSGSGGRITTDYSILINRDSDGDLRLSNSIIGGQTLVLTSMNEIIGSDNGGTNYIEAKILLPAGKGKVYYEYSINDYFGSQTKVIFKAEDFSQTFKTPRFSVSQRGGSLSGNAVYEFELKEPKEVTFRIETITAQKNEIASGKITVSFEPSKVESQHDVTPNTNDNQIKPVQLNFVDRINAWIQNFFNKIFGGSK